MSSRKKIALNTIVQFIGKGLTAATTLSVTILLARAFGVDGYGEYTKITAYVAFFLLLIDFGLNAVALPLMEEMDESTVFSHLFFLRLFFGIVLVAIAAGITIVLPYDTATAQGFSQIAKIGIVLMATTIIPQGIFLSGNAIFQRHLRYDRSVIAGSVGSLVGLVSLALVIYLHGNLLWAVTAIAVGNMVMAVVTIVLVRSFLPGLSLSFSPPLFWQLVKKSLPLGLTLIFNLIYLRANTIIMAVSRSTAEVGIFGLAYKFFEFTFTIPTFFMNAVYPIMLARRRYPWEFKKTVGKAFFFLLASSVVVMVLGFFTAPLFTVVKKEFVLSIVPFRIMVVSLPFFFLTSLSMWILIAFEKRGALLSIYGGSMLATIILNLIFVPQFGYIAAAIITVLGEGLILVASGYVSWKTLTRQVEGSR